MAMTDTAPSCAARCPYCHDPDERCAAPVAGALVDALAKTTRYYCASHLVELTPAPGQKITRYRPKENPTP